MLRLLGGGTTAIVDPAFFGRLDGLLLTLFRAATQQDHEAITVLAEIDSIARPRIDLSLKDSSPNPFHVRPIPRTELIQRCRNFGRGDGIEPFEPCGER